jgi:hypothetical protein
MDTEIKKVEGEKAGKQKPENQGFARRNSRGQLPHPSCEHLLLQKGEVFGSQKHAGAVVRAARAVTAGWRELMSVKLRQASLSLKSLKQADVLRFTVTGRPRSGRGGGSSNGGNVPAQMAGYRRPLGLVGLGWTTKFYERSNGHADIAAFSANFGEFRSISAKK